MTRRGKLSLLTALFAGIAAYGSFVPFAWRSVGWVEGWSRFTEMPFRPFEHLWTGDFFTNILVFMPIGFFGVAASNRRSGERSSPGARQREAIFPAFAVVAGCALFSTALEVGQIYIAARTPSWSDVFAQTVGAVLGAILWIGLGGAVLQATTRPLRARTPAERGYAMLGLYAVGWVSLRALPLVFPRFAHPLLELWRSRLEFSPLLLLGPLAIQCLAAVPLGMFLALSANQLGGPWRVVSMIAGTALVVAADAVRQVQLLPTGGHLAAALVGLAVGWLVASPEGAGLRAWLRARSTLAALVGIAMTSALLTVHYWAPFNFGVSTRALDFRIRILYERAPFHRYYWTPPLIALGEALTLVLLGGLVSALLRLSLLAGRRMSIGACAALTTLLFAGIEWGQLYLPGRRADPTDMMLAALGAAIGARLTSPPGGGQVRNRRSRLEADL